MSEKPLHPIEFNEELERTMRTVAKAKADSLRATGAPTDLIRDYDHYSAVGMFPCQLRDPNPTEEES